MLTALMISAGSALGLFSLLGLTRRSRSAASTASAGPLPTQISTLGTQFVAGFEGFEPVAAPDPVGHCTVGFGHLIHRGPCNGTEPLEFRQGISRERALALLQQDTQTAADAVRRLITVPLNQAQFDALVSFTFNVGEGNLATSTLRKLLNAGDYTSVPTQLNRFVFASGQKLPGLVRRRQAEGRLFAAGDYGLVS